MSHSFVPFDRELTYEQDFWRIFPQQACAESYSEESARLSTTGRRGKL